MSNTDGDYDFAQRWGLAPSNEQKAGVNVMTPGSAPEVAAKSVEMGNQFGVDPNVIHPNSDMYESEFKLQQQMDAVNANRAVAQHFSDPVRADVSQGDAHKLQDVDEYGNSLGILDEGQALLDLQAGLGGTAVARGIKRGYLEDVQGRKGFTDIEGSQEAKRQVEEMGEAGIVETGVEMGTGLIMNMMGALKYSAAGAATGAAAGAIAGGVGALPGAAAGMAAGFTYGMATDAAMVSAGRMWADSAQWRDEHGQPIGVLGRATASALAGVVMGGLMGVGGKVLGPEMESLGSEFLRDVMSRSAEAPGVMEAMTKIGRSVIGAGAAGGAFGWLQTIGTGMAEDIGQLVSGQDVKTVFTDPAKRQALLDAATKSMEGFAAFSAALHIPIAGTSIQMDRFRAHAAQERQLALDALAQRVQDTETFKRSPEVMRQFVDQSLNGVSRGVNAEAVEQLYAQEGKTLDDPTGPLGFVPDLKEQMERAQQNGDDVRVPLADVLVRPELYAQLRDHIRMDDANLTPAETSVPAIEPTGELRLESEKASEGVQLPLEAEQTVDKSVAKQEELGAGNILQEVFRGVTEPQLRIEEVRQIVEELEQRYGVQNAHEPGPRIQWDRVDEDDRNAIRAAIKAQGLEGEAALARLMELEREGVNARQILEARLQKEGMEPKEALSVLAEARRPAEPPGAPPEAPQPGPFEQTFGAAVPGKPVTRKVKGEVRTVTPTREPGAAVTGNTTRTYRQFKKQIMQLVQKNVERAQAAAARYVKRTEGKAWKESEALLRSKVMDDFELDPTLRVHDMLTGKGDPAGEFKESIKLDREGVKNVLGKEVILTDGTRVPMDELFKGMLKEHGESPQDLADLFGHTDGRSLVQSLADMLKERQETGETPAQQRKRWVEEKTRALMDEKHGNLDELMQEALDKAASAAEQIDLLHEELKFLNDIGGGGLPVDMGELRWNAKKLHDAYKLGYGVKTGAFERMIAKASQEGLRAWLRGDILGAFKAKQSQVMATLALKEAQGARQELQKFAEFTKKYSKNNVAGIDGDYLAQIQQVLKQLGFNVDRSNESLHYPKPLPSVNEFIRQREDEWFEDMIPLPDSLPQKISDFTVEDFRALRDTLTSIEHNGKDEAKLRKFGKAIEKGEIIQSIRDRADALKTKWDARKAQQAKERDSIPYNAKSIGRAIDASLVKVDKMLDWMEQNDAFGPLNTYVIRPLYKAQEWVRAKREEFAGHIRKVPQVDGLWEPIKGHGLVDAETGEELEMSRANLLTLALNAGTHSNWEVMTKGRELDPGQANAVLMKYMRPQDWAFVSGVWNTMEKLWPDVQRVSHERTGVAVDPIMKRQLPMPNGALMDGGWFPLIMDTYDRETGRKTEVDPLQMYKFGELSPKAQATQRRTGAIYKVSLDLNMMAGRLADTIHKLGYAEAIPGAADILLDPTVRRLIDSKFGEEFGKQLRPWLTNIASDGGIRDEGGGARAVSRFSMLMRQRAVLQFIGWNPATAILHGGSALSNSIGEVVRQAGWMETLPFLKNTIYQFFKNPETAARWTQFAHDNSPEMRGRRVNLSADMADAARKTLGKPSWEQYWQMAGTYMIAKLDEMSATPLWMTIYGKGMKEGLEHEDAVYAADKAVRNAHGSQSLVARAPVFRKGEMMKWLTMFGGYFNHNYNQIRDFWRSDVSLAEAIGKGDYKVAMARTATFINGLAFYVAGPAFWHWVVREYWPGYSKDEKLGVAGASAQAVLGQLAGSLPYVSGVAYSMMHHGAGGSSMLDSMAGEVTPLINDVKKLASGKNVAGYDVGLDALQAGVYATGARGPISHQTMRMTRSLFDLFDGRQRVSSYSDYLRWAAYGKFNAKRKALRQ